jgi:NTP pyrophosphatase (non-canonical NTP hydrolase)
MTTDISALRAKILEFRDARDWGQFHSLKNLVSALSVEASELLELTQWKTAQELEAISNDPKLFYDLSKEVADVFIYLLLICEKLGIDPLQAAEDKIRENGDKYPIDKSRGSSKKYSEL